MYFQVHITNTQFVTETWLRAYRNPRSGTNQFPSRFFSDFFPNHNIYSTYVGLGTGTASTGSSNLLTINNTETH